MEKDDCNYIKNTVKDTAQFYFNLMRQRVDMAADRNGEDSKKRDKKIAALAVTSVAIGLVSLILQVKGYLK